MLDVTDKPTETATLRLVPPSAEPKQETKFDWLTDNSVVLQEQPQTAVYFNLTGALVIRQQVSCGLDDDTFIFIAPQSIAEFIDKLTDVAGVPSVGGRS
jgi:hypothetical protein